MIDLLKQKYTILQLRYNFISSNNDTVVDKIVCCTCINMCPSVVPLE